VEIEKNQGRLPINLRVGSEIDHLVICGKIGTFRHWEVRGAVPWRSSAVL